jgi:hypothetical protein
MCARSCQGVWSGASGDNLAPVEPVDPERLLVATVAEDREPFARETVYLFKTLDHFGGNLSRARRVAYFVGSADSPSAQALADLGVTVKVVEPVDTRSPYANKLRMLDATDECDYLVALDTDVVITRDFSAYIQGSSVAAKPAGRIRLTLDQWRRVFDYFDLEMPQARYLTTARLDETIPYFNDGVLLVSKEHLSTLQSEWRSFINKLLDAYPELPEIAEHPVFITEFSLALALASAKLPFRALPLGMNFPTDRRVHPALEPRRLSPYILHHHHRLSPAGELLFCHYEEVNAVIAEVNACLRATEHEVASDSA